MLVNNIDVGQINQFSSRDKDYYTDAAAFKSLLEYDFDFSEFSKIIENRKKFPVNRAVLHAVVEAQYAGLDNSTKTLEHISKLKSGKSFTITTAHQPSLLTGPLYYIFKILSAIRLSDRLNENFPDNNFIPVFVIGDEDHDFEEINHLNLYSKKIEWESGHSGSVGMFPVDGIESVLDNVKEILGEKSRVINMIDELKSMLPFVKNYGEFSFRLTHALFDKYGLIILRMGDPQLKRLSIPTIKKEILDETSKDLVLKSQGILAQKGYKAQTHIRDINYFYKGEGFRNRIEREDETFKIVDKDIQFSRDEMVLEIEQHPERFSPNVITRPLYQSQILPDLVYIGGGGELAYWMERKIQFEAFNMHFPMLIRRRSAMITNDSTLKQSDKLGLSINDLFGEENDLVKLFLSKSDNIDYKLDSYKAQINDIFKSIEAHIGGADKSLIKTTQAESVKSIKSLDYLESKLKKSLKQKEEVNLNRISKLKQKLFPSGLQERHDNIFEYFSQYGVDILDKMLPHCDPFDKTFKVFVMQPEDR